MKGAKAEVLGGSSSIDSSDSESDSDSDNSRSGNDFERMQIFPIVVSTPQEVKVIAKFFSSFLRKLRRAVQDILIL